MGFSFGYPHYPNDLLQEVLYGNGTRTVYLYDAADRLQVIEHQGPMGNTILSMVYETDARGLITKVTESDEAGVLAVIDYAYDNLGRLTSEKRTLQNPYDLSYTYDLGGNRLSKTAISSGAPGSVVSQTVYHYDLDTPLLYHSKANRLMYYEVFEDSVLSERVDIEYELEGSAVGNPNTIVRDPEGDDTFYATDFVYHNNGEVRYIIERTFEEEPVQAECAENWSGAWQENCCESPLLYDEEGNTCCVVKTTDGCPEAWPSQTWTLSFNIINEQMTSVTEFRGQGRRRYMTRQRDPLDPDVILSTKWTQYDGDEPYADYTVDALGAVTMTTGYALGIAQLDFAGGVASYFHTDQIGTTRTVTDDLGVASSLAVFTAFGEKVDVSLLTRYQYAGAFGYESLESLIPLPLNPQLLHVGARYYDPAIGRFLQRDTVDISFAGWNRYEYVSNRPTEQVDPAGWFGITYLPGVLPGLLTPLPYVGGGSLCAPAAPLDFVTIERYERDRREHERKREIRRWADKGRGYLPWYGKIAWDIAELVGDAGPLPGPFGVSADNPKQFIGKW